MLLSKVSPHNCRILWLLQLGIVLCLAGVSYNIWQQLRQLTWNSYSVTLFWWPWCILFCHGSDHVCPHSSWFNYPNRVYIQIQYPFTDLCQILLVIRAKWGLAWPDSHEYWHEIHAEAANTLDLSVLCPQKIQSSKTQMWLLNESLLFQHQGKTVLLVPYVSRYTVSTSPSGVRHRELAFSGDPNSHGQQILEHKSPCLSLEAWEWS